jgi:hypothetical protein
MGDVSTADGKDKRFKRNYSLAIREFANKSLNEKEMAVYNLLFEKISKDNSLERPQEMMLLDLALFDFIRSKRLQGYIKKHGDVFILKDRNGKKYVKASEASYLLNAVESQFRQNMKELVLTKKEEVKASFLSGEKDLTSFLTIDANVVEVDEDAERSGNIREEGKDPVYNQEDNSDK